MSAANARQHQLPFTDPYEPRILPQDGCPFWTLNTLREGGGMSQRVYRLHQLEWVLTHCRKDLDTYLSQGFFAAPCRRALHLAYLTHAYVDLDLYKLLPAPRVGEAGIMLRLFCRDQGIPEPSLIIASGRGIYLKWCWSAPIPRAAAGRAVAVNKALVKLFAEWGADPAAVDVSRVLRVIGTTNTKSGEVVRILWQADRDGTLLTYDFDSFANEVLPYSLEQIREFRATAETREAEIRILSHERARRQAQRAAEERRRGNQRAFAPEDWHWGVLEDLRTLANLRYGGTVPRGEAAGPVGVDLFGHIGACQLARVVPAGQLWYEIQAWGRIILPDDYVNQEEFRRHCSTLLQAALRAAAGETTTYEGRQVSPIWTYRKQTIIERLQITAEEERHLSRLIGDDEKKHRHNEAREALRRAAGVPTRIALNAAAAERQGRAQALREAGLSWAEVAAHMDLPTAEAARQLVLRGRRPGPYG